MVLCKSGVAVVSTALLVVTLSGCSLFGRSEHRAAQQSRNDAAVTAIHDELMRAPGVVDVHVTYANNPTASGSSGVNLIVRKGTDLEQINELAVRTVWLSNLNPLYSILVGVGVDEDRAQGIAHNYNEFDDWDELEAEYGPRPVADR